MDGDMTKALAAKYIIGCHWVWGKAEECGGVAGKLFEPSIEILQCKSNAIYCLLYYEIIGYSLRSPKNRRKNGKITWDESLLVFN